MKSDITTVKLDPNATVVRLDNMPGVTALPEMPNATVVWLDNMPGVTALRDQESFANSTRGMARSMDTWKSAVGSAIKGWRSNSSDSVRYLDYGH